MTLAEQKNWCELLGKRVEIRWHSTAHDWPYFVVTRACPDGSILLRGADYPDGSARHDGGSFWVMVDEVKSVCEVAA